MNVIEFRRVSIDVDENHVTPDPRPEPEQAELFHVDVLMGVLAGAADMGGRAQFPVQSIAPAVIRAANGAADLARLVDQDHAAVAAGVLENADRPVPVADEQQGNAQKINRPGVAGLWDILAEADTRPV